MYSFTHVFMYSCIPFSTLRQGFDKLSLSAQGSALTSTLTSTSTLRQGFDKLSLSAQGSALTSTSTSSTQTQQRRSHHAGSFGTQTGLAK